MIFQVFFGNQFFRNAAAADALAFRLRAPFKQSPVSTGFGHPFDFIDIIGGEFQAFGNQSAAFAVTGAFAGLLIHILADDVGIKNFFGFIVLNFNQAAFAAVVADRFPFILGVVAEIFSHYFNLSSSIFQPPRKTETLIITAAKVSIQV